MKTNINISIFLSLLILLCNGCSKQAVDNVSTQTKKTPKEHIFQSHVNALNKAKQVESIIQESAKNRSKGL